jgi:hypothetical protein
MLVAYVCLELSVPASLEHACNMGRVTDRQLGHGTLFLGLRRAHRTCVWDVRAYDMQASEGDISWSKVLQKDQRPREQTFAQFSLGH